MKIIATGTQSGNTFNSDFSQFLAEGDIEYIPRNRKGIKVLAAENGADGVVVWSSCGPVLYIGDTKFFFHPSMAKTRLSNYRKFEMYDPFVAACDIKKDDNILDCTLGLGADAIVASYFTPDGRVVGLEYSSIIALMVKWGMALYESQMSWLNEAIKRIKVINADHKMYLKSLPDNSFDTVYFDPMFRKPVLKSQAISPLRLMANPAPLDKETVIEAVRVAKKRVVMKELYSSGEFERLGFTEITGSPHNKIAYGVIKT